ncbi:helix-turn-helix domain-containing protein [Microvirga tunisiensis]|uniref:helix-turn-helix domain-containing protein n=1 Tax=Microvirga tunisiensis TaxID=2108360 RepID=UPI003B84AC2E
MAKARNYPKRANPAAVPEIARRLRLLRRAVADSITDLSIQTGITRSVWSNHENGQSRIGVDAAMKLCERYHAPSIGFIEVSTPCSHTALPNACKR